MKVYPVDILSFSCAFLLLYLTKISRGQQLFSEAVSGSPAKCGSLKTVSVDDVVFINDQLSAEGRGEVTTYQRPRVQSSRDTVSNRYEHPPYYEGPQSFKESQYHNKLSDMSPRLENQFGWPMRDATKKPEDFSSFFNRKYTSPFSSENRRFPGQPSRILGVEEPKKKPRKKDMMDGLPGPKMVEIQKKNPKLTRVGRRHETPSKYPRYIQHLLELTNRQNGGTAPPPQQPEVKEVVPQRRTPVDIGRNRNENSGLEDLLSSLGPDKIQKLKKLLDNSDNEEETDRRIRNRHRQPYRDEERESAEEEHHRPPTYNLDSYTSSIGKLERGSRNRLGNSFEENDEREIDDVVMADETTIPPPRNTRPRRIKLGQHENMFQSQKKAHIESLSSEISDVRELPDSVSPHRRIKRAVSKTPFERLAEEIDLSRRSNKNIDNNRCTWIFKKAKNCNKLVVTIQYWIDGIRDCSKEYMKITGERQGEARLCGGQGELQPYVVKGDKVVIEHFKVSDAGPGVTKFKASVQCQDD